MAEIRCPNCKKENPDFLDACQFCGTSLRSDATLHTGETPTKKNTGELEAVLPDWLRDARQQARDSAEEEAVQAATQPKIQKAEPPDLLAGLAFQAGNAEEEDIPDWLASINPVAKPKPAEPASKPVPENDFFAQFNKSEPAATPQPPRSEPVDNAPTWKSGTIEQSQPPAEKEDLSAWFSQTAEQPLNTFSFESEPSRIDSGWEPNVDVPSSSQTPAPKEEEDLSWLHNLEATARQTDELKSPKQDLGWTSNFDTPSSSPSGQEDLSWLNNLGGMSAPSPSIETPPSGAQDDLSWLNDLGGTPISPTAQPSSGPQEDLSWLNNLGGTPVPEQPAASQPTVSNEDLSWLNNLGGASVPEQPAASQPSASDEDLNWLNKLGGTTEPTQSASSQDDLGWLNNLGGTPVREQPATSQPPVSNDDLSWLNNLGGTPVSEQPASIQPTDSKEDLGWLKNLGTEPIQAASEETASSQNDLSWLNSAGTTPETAQPATPQGGDLGWLNQFASTPEPAEPAASNDFGWLNDFPQTTDTTGSAPLESEQPVVSSFDETNVSPFSPAQTAPLTPDAEINSMPDWLRDATQASSSMPLGMNTLDQFRDDRSVKPAPEEPFSWKNFTLESKTEAEAPFASQQETSSVGSDMFSLPVESAPLSGQDVDSIFSMDMPDWLSQEPPKEEAPSQLTSVNSEDAGALAPVDLPSWVQAMRPMDAAISDTAVSIDNQPTEREGPLAGLRGVIPFAPIGSSQRPKAISLKLQASDEQQSSATLLEQLLANETAPRPIPATSAITSQSVLRWVISGLFLLVLSAVLVMNTQMAPVSSLLSPEVEALSNTIAGIPDNAQVLVVMDYEPALAGEMEASSGPVLDQLVLSHHSTLSFVTTSPNGSALVERLLTHSKISLPAPGGVGYLAGTDYFTLGYLPGGEAGVLAFVQAPQATIPNSTVATLSGYAAVIVLTDHAESARTWVEQIQAAKRADIMLTNQPLLVVASAQAGPLLQPYVSSRQVTGLVSGLAEAARYEYKNGTLLGTARSYWDAFSAGLLMAVVLIVAGSLWSLFTGMRTRRAETEQG